MDKKGQEKVFHRTFPQPYGKVGLFARLYITFDGFGEKNAQSFPKYRKKPPFPVEKPIETVDNFMQDALWKTQNLVEMLPVRVSKRIVQNTEIDFFVKNHLTKSIC